jgi:hypothetical protein
MRMRTAAISLLSLLPLSLAASGCISSSNPAPPPTTVVVPAPVCPGGYPPPCH